MAVFPWHDDERLPNLDAQSRARLQHLVEHPHAPTLRNRSGHHLASDELQQLQHFTDEEFHSPPPNSMDNVPWLAPFLTYCRQQVPFYQQYNKALCQLAEYPTISRSDLSRSITSFVPDDLPIDRMIAYETSGTTGHALTIPSHPLVAARYSAYHKKALAWHGIDVTTFQSDLAVILAGYQEKCFTYGSISPYLNNKGLFKLNFHPNDWPTPDDRQHYIDLNRPDLISGDPISLCELAKVPFTHQPQALLSTSMTLLAGIRKRFEDRYGCPVIDLYSLNETGPVGASVPGYAGFRLLQSRLVIEILGPDDRPVETGERGEIVVTGGFNDYLPLIRYRTGDFGRLVNQENAWFIRDLEGRPPVQYKTARQGWINNVDVTHWMQEFPISHFSLHQKKDGHLILTLPVLHGAAPIQKKLEEKFGYPVDVQRFQTLSGDRKVIQYTSDLGRMS